MHAPKLDSDRRQWLLHYNQWRPSFFPQAYWKKQQATGEATGRFIDYTYVRYRSVGEYTSVDIDELKDTGVS